jgi:hypothetical protein
VLQSAGFGNASSLRQTGRFGPLILQNIGPFHFDTTGEWFKPMAHYLQSEVEILVPNAKGPAFPQGLLPD